jgi:hypothetical protein
MLEKYEQRCAAFTDELKKTKHSSRTVRRNEDKDQGIETESRIGTATGFQNLTTSGCMTSLNK